MGDLSIYLVPAAEVDDPRRARADVVRLLQAEGIIHEQRCRFYPASENSECYTVGERNLESCGL